MLDFVWEVVPSRMMNGPGRVGYTKEVGDISVYCVSVSTRPRCLCSPPQRLEWTELAFALI